LNHQWSRTNGDPFKISFEKKSMGLFLRYTNLTSTATPFKYMDFSRNGNKRSSIESKNKGIGH
jgi:hypothetical protein